MPRRDRAHQHQPRHQMVEGDIAKGANVPEERGRRPQSEDATKDEGWIRADVHGTQSLEVGNFLGNRNFALKRSCICNMLDSDVCVARKETGAVTPWIQTMPEAAMRTALEKVCDVAQACMDRFYTFEFEHKGQRLRVAERERRAYLLGMSHGVDAARREFELRRPLALYGSASTEGLGK